MQHGTSLFKASSNNSSLISMDPPSQHPKNLSVDLNHSCSVSQTSNVDRPLLYDVSNFSPVPTLIHDCPIKGEQGVSYGS
ncbi:unnamed protein product [Protopolystoma xenopodis]|uniref:Uncharacterized protein n=1 Tax=Protopolystoma xenopodis TaxID=117903 RepID=A0A3S5FFS0_9PLAT|nr:unnamed protein product [Protopolystoma xenopodis]